MDREGKSAFGLKQIMSYAMIENNLKHVLSDMKLLYTLMPWYGKAITFQYGFLETRPA